MHQGIWWRLGYADDSHRDEPPEGMSIRLAPPSSVALIVMGNDSPLRIVWLDGWDAPVFYRIMYSDLGREGSSVGAVVCGRARHSDEGADSQLWLVMPNGEFVDCPAKYIDSQAIQTLLDEAGSGVPHLISIS